jgi:hypothetical protein
LAQTGQLYDQIITTNHRSAGSTSEKLTGCPSKSENPSVVAADEGAIATPSINTAPISHLT